MRYSPSCLPTFEIVQIATNCAINLKFGVEVESAKYEHATGKWEIVLTSGEKLTADIFISALGQLNRPSIPKLEGLEKLSRRNISLGSMESQF